MQSFRRLVTSRDVILILAGALLLALAAMVGVYWNPPQGATGAPLRDALVIFLGTVAGLIISIGASGSLTTQSTIEAVLKTISQNPEFVKDHFRPEAITRLLRSNLVAATGSEEFSDAVIHDLLQGFIDKEPSHVRTSQRYAVQLKYEELETGVVTPPRHPVWTCTETLDFNERYPFDLRTGSTIAALVFCESGLKKYFDEPDCIYRSVTWLPEALKDDLAARHAWATSHLSCTLLVKGHGVGLDPFPHLEGPRESWAVEFKVRTTQPEIDSILNAPSGETRKNAEVPVRLDAAMTLSPFRHSYAAYLAYPTRSPAIEFRIDGPVNDLECVRFYNLESWREPDRAGAGLGSRTHISIRAREDRWEFPPGGAVFSWITEDGRRLDTRDWATEPS